MKETTISNFYFNEYYVDNIEFNYNYKCEEKELTLDLDTEVNVSAHPKQNKGIVNIKIVIWDEAELQGYPFRIEVSITGQFSADEEMEHKQFVEMCRYNGSAILFPFLRSAVTDITKVANVSPLTLPLLNIKNLIDDE